MRKNIPKKLDNNSRPRHASILGSVAVMITGLALALPQAQAEKTFQPEASDAFVQMINDKEQRGNAILSAVYDPKQWHINGEKLPLNQKLFIDGQPIILQDDGRNGDKERGDNVFSAIVEFNFDSLIAEYKRIENFQKNTSKENTLLHFENRKIVGNTKIMSARELTIAIKRGDVIPLFPLGVAAAIDNEKSLLIRDPGVVQDPARTFDICTGAGNPNGIWTFKHLVTEMANTPITGVTPEDFVRMWLSHWENSQNINGWNVTDRNAGIRNQVIIPWENASGGPGSPLDLDQSPFQLLSIVNRVDLRENLTYGGGSAGEGRFVFQVMDQNCNPMQFTVIFEYGVEKNSCGTVKNWGQSWADLSSMVLGSPAYNAALENITETFVRANAAPSKPNGSALNQLRTNEIALGNEWELREFVIAGTGWNQHFLKQNTVSQTPDTSLNGSLALQSFVNSGASTVPLGFPTIATPFLGGASATPFNFFWDEAGIAPRQARHELSLNTCNGCHAGETATVFTHIKPGSIPAALSGFMTGITVADPADGAPDRTFNDLLRRATDLDGLVNSNCFSQLPVPILKSPH